MGEHRVPEDLQVIHGIMEKYACLSQLECEKLFERIATLTAEVEQLRAERKERSEKYDQMSQKLHDRGLKRLEAEREREEWKRKYREIERAHSHTVDKLSDAIERIQLRERDLAERGAQKSKAEQELDALRENGLKAVMERDELQVKYDALCEQVRPVSKTFGELPESVRVLIEPHVWDNMNISEQRDWAIEALSRMGQPVSDKEWKLQAIECEVDMVDRFVMERVDVNDMLAARVQAASAKEHNGN